MPCCVPGCINLLQEWTTELPSDAKLLARWKAAITAGTGMSLADKDIAGGALICNMHFVAQQDEDERPDFKEDEYREPSLFFRGEVLLQVISCQLCLRYDSIDSMFNKTYRLRTGEELQRVFYKYFKISHPTKETPGKGYFCESCTVQIDMADTFWQQIKSSARKYKYMLPKMANHRVVFKNTNSALTLQHDSIRTQDGYDSIEHEDDDVVEIDDDICVIEEAQKSESEDDVIEIFDDIVVKEESKLAEPDKAQIEKSKQVSVGQKQHPAKTSVTKFKCYICNTILDSKESQARHLIINHSYDKPFYCKECNMPFDKVYNYNRHLLRHDTKKPFSCSMCAVTFTRKNSKMYHESTKHGITHRLQATNRGKTQMFQPRLKP